MNLFRKMAALLISVYLILAPLQGLAKSIPPLAAPPLGERWFSISFADERTGFDRYDIATTPGGYEISNSGCSKMVVLGFSRQAAYRATYQVNRDLSLSSFTVEQTIGGNPTRLTGKVTPRGVAVRVESAGKDREKVLKTKGPVYPPPALNLYPLMKGAVIGKKYRVPMLDVEEVKIKEVAITALKQETLPDGTKTIHLRNDLYPFVDNDIWVDLAGNTVKESVRGGLIDTRSEPAPAARQFIVDAALAKRDLILDYSLVRTDRPLAQPAELKGLTLELSGFTDAIPLISDERQKGTRLDQDRVTFAVSNVAAGAGIPENGKYLAASDRIPSDNADIIAEKNRILAGETDALKKVESLVRWVAGTVGESADESRTAVDILRARKGDCQSHARLYAALARAAGIPTRFVSGLVYLPGKGFLYHSWAESFTGRWLAVDPTFGQVPADVTHIKLANGDAPGDMAAIVGLVGRLRAKIVDEKY